MAARSAIKAHSIARLLFAVALVLFIVAAVGANVKHAVEWGFAALAAGFLVG